MVDAVTFPLTVASSPTQVETIVMLTGQGGDSQQQGVMAVMALATTWQEYGAQQINTLCQTSIEGLDGKRSQVPKAGTALWVFALSVLDPFSQPQFLVLTKH
jgi:hypothetical protein